MSIFSNIFSKIFPSAHAAQPTAPTAAPGQAPAAAPGAAAAPAAVSVGSVETTLDAKPNASSLNWRTSIVDLLKLLDMDSSLDARKELATEIGFTGGEPGSAQWNTGLHRALMNRIAANGGTVPANLRD